MYNVNQTTLMMAVVAGSRRRNKALVTELYPLVQNDISDIVTLSMNIPIDGTGDYIDSQQATLADFSMELLTIVIEQNQQPDILLSNMTTGACDVDILTILEVEQNQFPDTLYSNMTTGVCSVGVLTITEITQDQQPETLYSNMTTGVCSVTIT